MSESLSCLMSLYQQHQQFYNQPIRLTQSQIKSPREVIEDFFSDLRLHDIREDLAKLLECAMITDCEHFEMPKQRASIITFLEHLEEMIEAAYLLTKKGKQ
jgi:hypothetical protein